MYLDFLVEIPEAKGKLLREKRGDTIYIKYEYDRTYDPKRKYTLPLRATIGKQSKSDETMMQPNQNFLKYFPESDLPLYESRTDRSSCLRIGAYVVISKIIRECKLYEILSLYFKEKELGFFLDLVIYSIIAENNAGQYYPMYAYNHPLFTQKMKIYSDSRVSNFLQSITAEQSVGFLNEWNANRNHREKIYISYDSTNKNCQAGDIEMAEFGKAKIDIGAPIFNYAIAYDTNNREPLFYEKYPGSINDVSQLRQTLNKAVGYGYKKIGFILDRGYFSKKNIEQMDACGYSFVIMVKGMASFVNQLILEHRGSFENKRVHDMDDYGLYGKTVKKKLYETDEKERYFHIYHSVKKEASERTIFEAKLKKMKTYLMEHVNEEINFGPIFQHYYYIHYEESGKIFVYPEERIDVSEKEIALCGYFVIVTSAKMTAKEAIQLYKSRDASEKLFRGDKSYLGNKSIRVHSDESARAKIFIEFVALILRSKLYTKLIDEMKSINKKPNYMTVPAALRELEKIEMVRQTDNVYRLDHAVTATQKTILKAFGLNEGYIKSKAIEISNELKTVSGRGGA
jgi:transposase